MSLPLWAVLLGYGATAAWAAETDRSRLTAPRAAVRQLTSVSGAQTPATAADPCSPSVQTRARAAEPSRRPVPALAGLSARAMGQESPSADLDPDGSLTLELWSSRISAPDSSDDVEASLNLKRLIRQVHRMTANDKALTPRVVAASEPMPMPQPAAPPAPILEAVPPTDAEVVVSSAPEAGPTLSAKAQKALGDLQQNPSRVRDPLETAELLFLSGRPGAAAPFYEEALRRTSAEAAASGSDRAWILFQLGNCYRETDAAKAQNSYAKLISEYPDSPWTEMARAGGRLLTWYQNTRPDQLLTPAP